jgi:hypothetical protein
VSFVDGALLEAGNVVITFNYDSTVEGFCTISASGLHWTATGQASSFRRTNLMRVPCASHHRSFAPRISRKRGDFRLFLMTTSCYCVAIFAVDES